MKRWQISAVGVGGGLMALCALVIVFDLWPGETPAPAATELPSAPSRIPPPHFGAAPPLMPPRNSGVTPAESPVNASDSAPHESPNPSPASEPETVETPAPSASPTTTEPALPAGVADGPSVRVEVPKSAVDYRLDAEMFRAMRSPTPPMVRLAALALEPNAADAAIVRAEMAEKYLDFTATAGMSVREAALRTVARRQSGDEWRVAVAVATRFPGHAHALHRMVRLPARADDADFARVARFFATHVNFDSRGDYPRDVPFRQPSSRVLDNAALRDLYLAVLRNHPSPEAIGELLELAAQDGASSEPFPSRIADLLTEMTGVRVADLTDREMVAATFAGETRFDESRRHGIWRDKTGALVTPEPNAAMRDELDAVKAQLLATGGQLPVENIHDRFLAFAEPLGQFESHGITPNRETWWRRLQRAGYAAVPMIIELQELLPLDGRDGKPDDHGKIHTRHRPTSPDALAISDIEFIANLRARHSPRTSKNSAWRRSLGNSRCPRPTAKRARRTGKR